MQHFKLHRHSRGELMGKAARAREEAVWDYVQMHHGEMAIHRHNITFTIDDKNAVFLAILFPFLEKVS